MIPILITAVVISAVVVRHIRRRDAHWSRTVCRLADANNDMWHEVCHLRGEHMDEHELPAYLRAQIEKIVGGAE
jgi:hypothetical protein